MKNVKKNLMILTVYLVNQIRSKEIKIKEKNKGMYDIVISKKIIDNVNCNPVELEQD